MTWNEIVKEYQKLQNIYGEKTLDPITSGGKMNNPDICFVFMNPTARNIAAEKTWTSLKAPWIGTKTIWKLFTETNLLDKNLLEEIRERKGSEWDYDFTEKVYKEIEERGVYITNLAKCTQKDARPLPNSVFKQYLDLLYKELELVKPKKIVTFGNQVSSIFLQQPISVSKNRREIFKVEVGGNEVQTLPVYYPVGQGQRNVNLSIEDINWFKNS